MRYFRIPRFTGIEAHRTDVDRGVLRICEGAIPAPIGSLRSGPVWTALGGDSVRSVAAGKISTYEDDVGNFIQMVSTATHISGIHISPDQTKTPPVVGVFNHHGIYTL